MNSKIYGTTLKLYDYDNLDVLFQAFTIIQE